MPLDSDIQNADDRLHVEFYINDRDKTHKGKTFVRIAVPGDQTNVIDRPMRDSDATRFHRQWYHFQRKNAGEHIPGIRLEEWHAECPDDISESQLNELTILKFQVVEQIATASDSQLQRVAMGGIGLRSKAQAYMTTKRARMSNQELDETKRELAELKEQMAQLLAMQTEKRGPGRPPKEA
jgi:hypothetical protein